VPYASYNLALLMGLIWRWEVEIDGAPVRRGLALSKDSARWAARNYIRNMRPRCSTP